jgi:hypothetical protein
MIRRCARHQRSPDDRHGGWYRVPSSILVYCDAHGGGASVQPPNLMLCNGSRHMAMFEVLEWRGGDA